MDVREGEQAAGRVSLEPDGWVLLLPDFVSKSQADRLFQLFFREIPWESRNIRMFGRWIPQPRLVSWQGDPGTSYQYSGSQWTASGWHPAMKDLADKVSLAAGQRFNSVLCNLYRDGTDSMGWHADNERELGPRPLIASVSLGGGRRFTLRPRSRQQPPKQFLLEHGSLLLMGGALQSHWQHALPKTRKPVPARINLTFRTIRNT